MVKKLVLIIQCPEWNNSPSKEIKGVRIRKKLLVEDNRKL
jgi:hypothetical protein